ncbi:toprim domain-containing protein [Burkholderia gladioli pv. alliicola]|uniref:toprim domain-containing protein n=1 Tax=Burkholderia gladioli TaxID=28095 RepID=UPI002AB8B0C4|nr:toprim domain-containing protein [Burkholderia gladioli]MDZ4036181.1 toprim domain-containing protein [Burkholderia gladioli pv. alliicola]
MASIDELKQRIDLHDLADRLGMKRGRGGDRALYHSPQHEDKSPSLSIFVNHPKHGTGWRDHSADTGGSCVDLVMYARGGSVADAVRYLHDAYGIPTTAPAAAGERREKSMIDYIADKCLAEREGARAYLSSRGISAAAIDAAIAARSLGFNTWTSSKVAAGEVGHAGPAAAFVVRSPHDGRVVAVDMRYLDPAINGGVKTQTQGDKAGFGWTADPRRLAKAKRVYVVESAINALSIDSCALPGAAALALRGLANVGDIDFTFLRGRQVVICLDNDEPFGDGHPRAGHRPGPEAAWGLYERLTSLNISAVLVDQAEWLADLGDGEAKAKPINDVNDYLQVRGADQLGRALDQLEPWLIAGLAGDATRRGRPRIFLPSHDFAQYWRFRVRPDFTSYITKMDRNEESGVETPVMTDLCGFRIAGISRVSVASATATMTGDDDQAPTVYFAVSVQAPRHGPQLIRRVMLDDQLHNVDQWGKFGPIWAPAPFKRMVNILERGADLGARQAANFVGLAWRDGRLIVNEGPDCYFTEADKQCPYHNLTFPSGPIGDARRVITAYQATFKQNAATIPLVWALGGHLKALLGFWPHMTVQANKGAGKSTLIKRLERSLAFTMFSGQSLQTEFRLLTSISHTSHPVGWEELSARRQDVIDKAVGLLQENYQYTVTRRGTDMTEYLLCAPVMLAGEDVPVRSLLGKLVRTTLTGKRGPLLPDDLPRFPVRQWLEFLAGLDKRSVLDQYGKLRDKALANCRASGEDDGAKRMAGNYAALALAWRLLCEFAGMDPTEGDFPRDLVAEMNTHVAETSADREPWVWIMETAMSEMDCGNYKHPFTFDTVDGEFCLLINTGHVMDHLAHTSALRDKWNGLPVKSDRVFKAQLKHAGVVVGDKEVERRVYTRRVRYLTPISVDRLASYGLHVSIREDLASDAMQGAA